MSAAHPTWTPELVRKDLEEFLAGRSEWPSYRDFQRQGKRGLRDAVTRFGGARHWAAELGVAYIERPPGYSPIWTEPRIRADLNRFLTGREVWPSRIEFEQAGLKALRDAIGRTGGPERWAAEFDLPRRNERSGSRRVWSDERIEAELCELINGAADWPTTRRFKEADKERLLASVYARGGPTKWARRLGVRRPPRSRPRRETLWTEQRIERELKAFCAGCSRWPRFREFEAAGRGKVYRAASRHGGVRRWKRRLGLS